MIKASEKLNWFNSCVNRIRKKTPLPDLMNPGYEFYFKSGIVYYKKKEVEK